MVTNQTQIKEDIIEALSSRELSTSDLLKLLEQAKRGSIKNQDEQTKRKQRILDLVSQLSDLNDQQYSLKGLSPAEVDDLTVQV